jgi:hypothetical protein
MRTQIGPLAHCFLLALAGAAWIIAVGGNVYAQLFVSDAVGPLDVMSAQTLTGVLVLWVAWGIAALAFVLSLYALWSQQRTRASTLAAFVSGAYVLPSVALLAYAALFAN